MPKVRVNIKTEEMSLDELLMLTGGRKFVNGEVIQQIGGLNFVIKKSEDPTEAFFIPIKVLGSKYYPRIKWVISYAVLKGDEYVVLQKYRQYKRNGKVYPIFLPFGKGVWIRKEIAEDVGRAFLEGAEYSYSPDSEDIVDVIEVKPHRSQYRKREPFEDLYDIKDFL